MKKKIKKVKTRIFKHVQKAKLVYDSTSHRYFPESYLKFKQQTKKWK